MEEKGNWYRRVLMPAGILGICAVLGAAAWKLSDREGGITELSPAGVVSDRTEENQEENQPQEQELLEPRKIALTFDDGQKIEGHEEVVRRIAEKGHLIGNHTFHHVQVTGLSREQACAEIDETSRLIESVTGKGTEYIRPPFGTWNEGLEEDLDLIPVMWTIDTKDWMTENVDAIVEHVVQNAGENDIILMHDCYESTVQATERIIALLQARGFEFVTVDEVLFD